MDPPPPCLLFFFLSWALPYTWNEKSFVAAVMTMTRSSRTMLSHNSVLRLLQVFFFLNRRLLQLDAPNLVPSHTSTKIDIYLFSFLLPHKKYDDRMIFRRMMNEIFLSLGFGYEFPWSFYQLILTPTFYDWHFLFIYLFSYSNLAPFVSFIWSIVQLTCIIGQIHGNLYFSLVWESHIIYFFYYIYFIFH